MSLRDLGYRPYEGVRLPPSHNAWVLVRYGLSRAWASLLVKLSVFFGWVPGAVVLLGVAIFIYLQQQGVVRDPAELDVRGFGSLLLTTQLWLFSIPVALGAGAGAIAEDLTHRAFQFYFAKPVTPLQYLIGRAGAVALIVFALCFLPSVVDVAALAVAAPPELRLEWASLIFPALLQSLAIALSLSIVSIGVSALGRSRALTMSAFLLLMLIPHVVASMVAAFGDIPWVRLLSLPGALGVLNDALLRSDIPDALPWYQALIALAVWTVGAGTFAFHRLRSAEVIS